MANIITLKHQGLLFKSRKEKMALFPTLETRGNAHALSTGWSKFPERRTVRAPLFQLKKAHLSCEKQYDNFLKK